MVFACILRLNDSLKNQLLTAVLLSNAESKTTKKTEGLKVVGIMSQKAKQSERN